MAEYIIQSFKLPLQEGSDINVSAAVIEMTEDFEAQLKKVQDLSTPAKDIYQYVGLVGQTSGSVYPGKSPYAIIKIEDVKEITTGASGLVIEELVELSIALIFQSSPTDAQGNDSGIQKWGTALRELTNSYLADKIDGATNGFDAHPKWQFSKDTNFKAKLDRNVAPLTGGEEPLKDSLFRVYLQKKVRVFPRTGL